MLQNVIAGGSVRRYVVCHFLDSALTVCSLQTGWRFREVFGGFGVVWRFENGMQWFCVRRGMGIQLIKD